MIHIVVGPPAAGKTTFVSSNARPGDLRLDFDALANTLTGVDTRHYPEHISAVVGAAWCAAVDAVLKQPGFNAWIIHAAPPAYAIRKYARARAQFHVIDPGRETVEKRCQDQRPEGTLELVERWYRLGFHALSTSSLPTPAEGSRRKTSGPTPHLRK